MYSSGEVDCTRQTMKLLLIIWDTHTTTHICMMMMMHLDYNGTHYCATTYSKEFKARRISLPHIIICSTLYSLWWEWRGILWFIFLIFLIRLMGQQRAPYSPTIVSHIYLNDWIHIFDTPGRLARVDWIGLAAKCILRADSVSHIKYVYAHQTHCQSQRRRRRRYCSYAYKSITYTVGWWILIPPAKYMSLYIKRECKHQNIKSRIIASNI